MRTGDENLFQAATTGDPPLLPEPSPEVIFKRVTEGAVLLSTEDEVYFGLNEVGAQIWELLATRATLEDLAAGLKALYPEVDPDTLRADTTELVNALLENGLLKAREKPE